MTAIQDAAQTVRRWRESPATFVRECFGATPDRWQLAVLEAWSSRDPKAQRIAMQACVGPGKTAVMAWLAWNFLTCYADATNHPVGLATAISGDNLKDNLWKELAVWQARSPFLTAAFTWTQTRVFANDHPETWWLSARTYAKTADGEAQGRTLSGLHGKYIAYFLDESGDMAVPVLRAAEQGLANCAFGKIVQAGNPTSLDGALYEAAANQAERWTVVRINGDPDDPDRSPRIDLTWAKEQIERWGRSNPWVMSSILGQFPPASINALLGPDEVRDAMQRHHNPDTFDWAQKRLGIDPARFGDDRTVIFPRQGLAAFNPIVMRSARGTDIAARIMAEKVRWGSEVEIIDATGGWGQSAEDSLRAAGYVPHAVQFHAPAIDPRYANRRAEGWWMMAEWVKRGGALPNVPELVAELTAPTYTYQGGKLLIEPKDQVKKRIGRSPDLADALALTFMLPELPKGMVGQRTQGGQAVIDYDPHAEPVGAAAALTAYDPYTGGF